MDWLKRSLLSRAFRKRRLESEMREEMRQHLEMRAERNMAQGMDPDAARRAAELAFGGMEQIKERCRDESGWPAADRLGQDLRFAGRQMRRNPSFTAVVVLTFALGIAATAVIFSLAYAVLLRPLPFPHPEQLVTLGERHLLKGYSRGTSYPDFLDWKSRSTSFAGLDGMTTSLMSLNRGTATERIVTQRVTGGFFSLIGVRPELGRWLTPSDDRQGVAPVVVISHSLWQRDFDSRPDVVGKRIRLDDDQDYILVGVMPAAFVSITDDLYDGGDTQPEIWTPLAMDAAKSSRNAGPLRVFGRLKTGVTLETAAMEMREIAAQLAAEYPADNENFTVRVGSMRGDLTDGLRPALYLLMTAVAFLLVISCLNIANLLLVRSTTRVAELSLRAALGADRRRIVAQLLTESALISLLGGSLGVVLAWTVLHILQVLFPNGDIPWGLAKLNWPVLVVSVAASLMAGIGFGLVPAIRCSRLDLNEALKSGGNRAFSQSRNMLQRTLVIVQVALAFVLLSGATLLHKSLVRLLEVNPGFEAANVLTVRTYLAGNNYNSEVKRKAFYDTLFARLSAIPGVKAAGGVLNLPMCGYRYTWDFEIDGKPKPKGVMNYADYQIVTPEYFSVIHMPLKAGRSFSSVDSEKGELVVIINSTMAKEFWPEGGAIGKRIKIDGAWYSIVGIVGDVHHIALNYPVRPETYMPHLQHLWMPLMLALRTDESPSLYAGQVNSVLMALDPSLPPPDIRPLSAIVSDTLADRRMIADLLTAFAASALALAALGLYGTLSYAVARRTREIGIRVALGSPIGRVRRLVMGQGLALSAYGLLTGIAISLAMGRILESQLFAVTASDPLSLTEVALLLLGFAIASCWLPAARAARIDPMIALKCE
jgi:putative ABC transport system permease protein